MGMRCKKPGSKISTERFRLVWNGVPYEPGELKAVAYKEGQPIGEDSVRTAGEPYRIRLTPDRSRLIADGNDLSYILIEAFDIQGNPCPLAGNLIVLKITGPGKIAGVGNGDPRSFEPFQAEQIKLFNGKAMVIVRTDLTKGLVEVSGASEGLISDRILLKTE